MSYQDCTVTELKGVAMVKKYLEQERKFLSVEWVADKKFQFQCGDGRAVTQKGKTLNIEVKTAV